MNRWGPDFPAHAARVLCGALLLGGCGWGTDGGGAVGLMAAWIVIRRTRMYATDDR